MYFSRRYFLITVPEQQLVIWKVYKPRDAISCCIATHKAIAVYWQLVNLTQVIQSRFYPVGVVSFVVIKQYSQGALTQSISDQRAHESKVIYIKIEKSQANGIVSAEGIFY
jgi:hypothetical protein